MKYPLLLLAVFLFLGCPEEAKYHVYYHGKGTTGSPPKDSRDYSSGETVTILGKGSLAKGDYTFIGWKVNIGYYDRIYYEEDNLTIYYDDVNLYAV